MESHGLGMLDIVLAAHTWQGGDGTLQVLCLVAFRGQLRQAALQVRTVMTKLLGAAAVSLVQIGPLLCSSAGSAMQQSFFLL
jgi:hypothetical protein